MLYTYTRMVSGYCLKTFMALQLTFPLAVSSSIYCHHICHFFTLYIIFHLAFTFIWKMSGRHQRHQLTPPWFRVSPFPSMTPTRLIFHNFFRISLPYFFLPACLKMWFYIFNICCFFTTTEMKHPNNSKRKQYIRY
jgi:hypothetical protein